MTSSKISIPGEFISQAMVLAILDQHANAAGVKIMVVGAFARDLLIRGVGAGPAQRLTKDIDIAVAVDSWKDLARLTHHLESLAGAHKFRVLGTEVDVVPFEGVEDKDRFIVWPDDHRMSVLGFSEAFRYAVTVDLGPVSVQVASLGAQVVLKLQAWSDRHLWSVKDAVDILTLLRASAEGAYADEIYDRPELLAIYDFDLDLSGAHHLGAQGAELLGRTSTAAAQIRVLLVSQLGSDGLLPAQMGADIARNRRLLEALRDGFFNTEPPE